ncbi:hypothetical protein ATZ33_11835 [Enterococcus silesiacus]|uniref:HTH cro/C1-type domain-containing protein n=1 Tax=Enterococcus silesiacus TaxID=332949 RepID=A0A0S3KCU4_9ENTE|nr:Rgg/GadR/MutR family transcriptional regulator [Enterococcus silesiacus]ALS02050.1 hypothetical protein ATZ33_11835 [Enterococcus silesiacus]OJG88948.1 hypothetical protein RV15_GL001684 [Enterococcus silesiacus]
MKIGTTLKNLRTGKNITRQNLVKGIMSVNHYYKVEKNENNLSVDKCIKILSRLNVTFDEFLFIANDYKNNSKKLVGDTAINLYYSGQNTQEELQELQEKCIELFKKTDDVYYQHHSILISTMTNNLQLTKQEIDILINYFFKVDNYGLYEIKMFTNFAYLFDSDILVILSNNILEKFLKFEAFEETNKDYVFFLLNLINVFHTRAETDLAYRFIELAENQIKNSTDFFSLTVLKYHQGINKIQTKNFSGKELVEEALLIFKKLHNNFYTLYKKEYEDYLDLYKQPYS